MSAEPWLITATPPTPNGDLHLGHLSGPYLAADILGRHLRRRAPGATTMTGIDDNQSYTEAHAVREGTKAADVARWFGDRIVDAWEGAGVRFDVIGRPDQAPHHAHLTRRIFRTLVDRGDIVPRVRPLPYCVPCDRWAFEAYVVGSCPHCGTRSCGNACEVCGRPNDCADLGDPRCTVCGAACELRDCERLYFPLARHVSPLRRFWSQVRMNSHLTALCAEMAADGLPEIAVSHPATWGVEVPVEEFPGHRVYVWFEMAAGYLAAGADGTGHPGVWRPGRRVAQCFGYDNGYFHAVLFPAIMHAYDPDVPLPTDFISNEFYRLDGEKFSTSRRHAVWLLDALETTPADHLRLYLTWTRPVAAQTTFTWAGMRTVLYDDVFPRWRGWLTGLGRRCGKAAANDGDGGPPTVWGRSADRRVRELRALTADTLRVVDEAYSVERFSPHTAVRALDLLVRAAEETGDDAEHLTGRLRFHDIFARAVHAELAVAAVLSAGLYPVAPELGDQLWKALGHPGSAGEIRWNTLGPDMATELKAGDLVGACPLLTPGRAHG
ncbi:methionyl-tRNA synthetase [Sinosporangium album]|uniref:Methionyl-tRNA synthetase n=1 Tax=Sinosporangium album TaxID=504805 RepID=A0A1G7QU77_9ACTN|nr:class I tRNA ligase family protein [Sinosporangium album]SDG02076.1 methionyl-tRNA synthetase [Sinosporangium album]